MPQADTTDLDFTIDDILNGQETWALPELQTQPVEGALLQHRLLLDLINIMYSAAGGTKDHKIAINPGEQKFYRAPSTSVFSNLALGPSQVSDYYGDFLKSEEAMGFHSEDSRTPWKFPKLCTMAII